MVERTSLGMQASCSAPSNEKHSPVIAYSTPFVGYAILSAVDVLSAGGLLRSYANVIVLIENGLAIFGRFGRVWASARVQSKAIRGRLDRLVEAISSKAAASKRAWKCITPLDTNFGSEHDIFYDIQDKCAMNLLSHFVLKISENEVLLIN